ncbi:MAG: lipopolysaccharide biosynthesis protein [Thiohalomonadaceae bacterium]
MENERSGFHRRVVAGFAWQGATKFAVQAISWVSTILVARLLAPTDYGLMAIAGVFISLMTLIMDMGLAQGLVQRSKTTPEQEDAVFWFSLLLGGGLFLLLFFSAPLIAEFYDMPTLTALLQLCACGLVISSLRAVPFAMLMRRMDFRSRALVEMSASLGSMLTVVTLAFNGFGVWSLAWGTLVQQAIVTLGFLRTMQRRPRLRFRWSRIKGILSFGLNVTGANVAFVVSSQAGVFIIGKFLGGHLTGIYSLALQLATMPLDKIGAVFNQVGFPSLARVKDDDEQCRSLFRDLHRYLLFIAYPILFGMAVVARDMIEVLLGEKWLAAAPILQVICAVNVVRISGMLITPLLNSRGRAREAFHYSLTGALLLPPAFLVGVQFGIEGVVIAWLLAYPVLYAMLLRYLYREIAVGLGDLVTDSRPTLTATALMAGAVLLFQELTADFRPVLRLIGSIGLGASVYIAVFVVLYGEQVARMRAALRALRSGKIA